MTCFEQQKIELASLRAPVPAATSFAIMVEMGLRPYRELDPRCERNRVDLENGVVHRAEDSKTVTGVADMPMTDMSYSSVP